MPLTMGGGAAQGLEVVLARLFQEQQEKQRIAEASRRMTLDEEQHALALKRDADLSTQRGLENENNASQEVYEREQDASERKRLEGRMIEMDALSQMGRVAQDPRDRANISQQMANRGGRLVEPEAPKAPERMTINGRIVERGENGWQEVYSAPAEPKPRRTGFHNDALIDMDSGETIRSLPGKTAGGGESVQAPDTTLTERISGAIDDLLPDTSHWTVGVGSMMSGIPTTDARNYNQRIQSLKGNIALGELARLRSMNSRNGSSGLGQITEREIQILERAMGALDTGGTPEQVRKQLTDIKAQVTKIDEMLKTGGVPSAGVSIDAAKAGAGGGAPASPIQWGVDAQGNPMRVR